MSLIPVVDLFAGPGGLGEGFSALRSKEGNPVFDIVLSIEKDVHAHKTLELRSFFRKISRRHVPEAYYNYIKMKSIISSPKAQEKLRAELFTRYPEEAEFARSEVWCAELGEDDKLNDKIDRRIQEILRLTDAQCWGIIGGPPCQAYSVIGRARNKGIIGYTRENDTRSTLYKQYLRVIAQHRPDFFIMENVKGMLSTRLNGDSLFGRIIKDLSFPTAHLEGSEISSSKLEYQIFSLAGESPIPDIPADYIIEAEHYGIPQTRHRVILLGVRKGFSILPPKRLMKHEYKVTVQDVLDNLPKLRSGVSGEKKENCTFEFWAARLKEVTQCPWLEEIDNPDISFAMELIASEIEKKRMSQGGEYIACKCRDFAREELSEWYTDERLGGVCNHTSRSHMVSDLYRYLFAATFAEENKRSPLMYDFPPELLPEHKSARSGYFDDRFRVQIDRRPSSTITSHISKDGHYFIHYDPEQCRSLTVREAARLQTFPDNYYFEGPRTQQYIQVGNAVPPLLARQIADVVYDLIKRTQEHAKKTDGFIEPRQEKLEHVTY